MPGLQICSHGLPHIPGGDRKLLPTAQHDIPHIANPCRALQKTPDSRWTASVPPPLMSTLIALSRGAGVVNSPTPLQIQLTGPVGSGSRLGM